MTDVSVGFRPPCGSLYGWAPKHGVSIQISINLGTKFPRISRIRKIAVSRILARVFAYLPSFISQILEFIYWPVLIFILIYFELHDWKPAIHNFYLWWPNGLNIFFSYFFQNWNLHTSCGIFWLAFFQRHPGTLWSAFICLLLFFSRCSSWNASVQRHTDKEPMTWNLYSVMMLLFSTRAMTNERSVVLILSVNISRPCSHYAGEIWNFTVNRPTVHTNPSRKRSFSKTLFKPEGFENAASCNLVPRISHLTAPWRGR